ncbi:hypothetical protein HMPREF1599_05932 [Escherichia coli 907713]|nr:hypothetical protein HMPREF1599_05932 [Escherichia coli 907713]
MITGVFLLWLPEHFQPSDLLPRTCHLLLNALWRILPSGFRRFAPQSATFCTANNGKNIPALR